MYSAQSSQMTGNLGNVALIAAGTYLVGYTGSPRHDDDVRAIQDVLRGTPQWAANYLMELRRVQPHVRANG